MRMTPSEAFVETPVAQGVTHVFGIVGSAYMDALDLFPAAGIRFVSTAHEQGAAHMADAGWAAVSRALGAEGVAIEKLSDAGPALAAACEAQRAGRTTVLEMLVTRELGDPFRRDALRRPVWLLDKYKASSA